MLVDGVQLVVAQTRKECLPHRQCVDIGVLVPADARLLPCFADEQHIKAVGVVGHKNVVPAKFFKSADGLLGRRGVGDHGIVDAGQVNDLLRDRLAGVDEGAELLFLVDLAVLDIDRADLGQALGCGGCMAALRRTEASNFRIDEAVTLEDVQREGEALLRPTDSLFRQYPAYTIPSAEQERKCLCGNPLRAKLPDGLYRVYGRDGAFLALSEAKDGTLTSKRNFFSV